MRAKEIIAKISEAINEFTPTYYTVDEKPGKEVEIKINYPDGHYRSLSYSGNLLDVYREFKLTYPQCKGNTTINYLNGKISKV
jgi:hypothetical protein